MCSGLMARALDRLNVSVVAWRLRQDSHVGEGAFESSPVGGALPPAGEPRPIREGTGRQLWGAAETDWVAARFRGATGSASPRTVIFLHGWLATGLQLAYYRWLASPLLREGDLWLPRLPAHAERTPPGAVSGSRCLGPDPWRAARAIRTAVAETRWLARWLRRRGETVAIWGISLGGWVAALAAQDPVCDRLVLWEPVVDPLETADWSPLGDVIAARSSVRATDAALVEAFEALSPARSRLAIPGDRVLVVGGVYDNVVRHQTLVDTGRAWGARVVSLRHGHISLLLSRRARRMTLASLRA